jgi:hypothetical protein
VFKDYVYEHIVVFTFDITEITEQNKERGIIDKI